jgi:hypothetical protein
VDCTADTARFKQGLGLLCRRLRSRTGVLDGS